MLNPTGPERDVEIVLVEDNPHDVEFLLRALHRHRHGSRVGVLRDGAEALEFFFPDASGPLRALLPKLVLLDLQLPKVHGFEVLRRIKSDERLRVVPVVVLSSSNEDEDLRACYRLGANSYVVKPVAFEAFLTRVIEVGQYWLFANEPPR
jgi:two-component system, response regulator